MLQRGIAGKCGEYGDEVKLIISAILLFIGWQTYHVGFNNGLRSSAEYSSAMAEKEITFRSAEIARLNELLATYPTEQQCIPILNGKQIDEYTFCEELLTKEEIQEDESRYDHSWFSDP